MAGSHGRVSQKVKARLAHRSRQCSADRIASLYFSPIPRAAFTPPRATHTTDGSHGQVFRKVRAHLARRSRQCSADRIASLISRRSRGRHLHHVGQRTRRMGSMDKCFGRSKHAGAPVTAVLTAHNRISLFLADPGGGIYTTSGNAHDGWEPWTSVSEGSSTPGAHLSAVLTGSNRIALFLADPAAAFTPHPATLQDGWQPWTSVSEGRSTPGAPVSAVLTGPNRITLLLADPAGGIYTSSVTRMTAGGRGGVSPKGRAHPARP